MSRPSPNTVRPWNRLTVSMFFIAVWSSIPGGGEEDKEGCQRGARKGDEGEEGGDDGPFASAWSAALAIVGDFPWPTPSRPRSGEPTIVMT